MHLQDVHIGEPIMYWDKRTQCFFFCIPDKNAVGVSGWGMDVDFQARGFHVGRVNVAMEELQYCYKNDQRIITAIFKVDATFAR